MKFVDLAKFKENISEAALTRSGEDIKNFYQDEYSEWGDIQCSNNSDSKEESSFKKVDLDKL